jgi:threonine/homoserine/homoserine lactone efflux protein
VVTIGVSAMRRFLGSRRARRIVDATMGAILIGVGVRIATT